MTKLNDDDKRIIAELLRYRRYKGLPINPYVIGKLYNEINDLPWSNALDEVVVYASALIDNANSLKGEKEKRSYE